MNSTKKIAALIHETIDEVTTAAEDIHRSIAAAPLDIARAIEPLEKPVGELRAVQDRSITAIYAIVRRVNQRIGELTADLLPG